MKRSLKSIDISGKTLTLETGVLAQQATSAVLARLGDTMVLSTVVMGKVRTDLDYFPLSVEYIERLYAGGRIKGSRWVKREGRPSDEAILAARLIDRSIRPLFPKDFKKEVQVINTVLSVDGENDPNVLGIVATSAALAISKIPWNGPVGSVRVGLSKDIEGDDIIINPKVANTDSLTLDMIVSSISDKVLMLEAGAFEVSEKVAFDAMLKAKGENKRIIGIINELVQEVGEKKQTVEKDSTFSELCALIEKSYKDDVAKLIEGGVNKEVGDDLDELAGRIFELENSTQKDLGFVKKALDYIFKKTIRQRILKDKKRPDNRKIDEIRPLTGSVSVLPRTHGSAIFQRGETQALTVTTLGTPSLEQLIESAEGEETKRYMHHYSFPPYSVGETGRIGTPNRREIGHGALAERALLPVIPSEDKFPYTIRVVSEVMSSNGSTSMASVCGSTLSLMDAGVPLKEPIAGIAMGIMTPLSPEGKTSDKDYVILTDIMGLEDFSGDMDFKVAGSKNGITAIQLDVKIDGLTDEMIEETLNKAKDARLFILDKMLTTIPQPREAVSQFAPKIKTIKIDTDKIGDVIGSGGRIIKNIISSTGASVDVEDDGTVTISAVSQEAVDKAVEWISLLTRELQKGETFQGTVKRIMPFGAFVEIVPGKEGLVHVSEMSTEYVNDPSEVVKIGQPVNVRVREVDDQGRINLSMVFGEKEDRRREEEQRPPRRDMRPESRYYGRPSRNRGPSDQSFRKRRH